ncbi:phage scaffolding protein [Ruminococcus sp.]|uniref:phage scaffolding protein n=1 Tax=Ruminococcus sp. TaxID=41978 RepID=UPI0025E7EEF1|nr:phage scaffolding protein [Ruminococcus sp.]
MAEETKPAGAEPQKNCPDGNTDPAEKTYTEAEYNALQEQLEQTRNDLKQAQKQNKANTGAQASQQQDQIRISQLEAELKKVKLDAAIQLELLKSGALDTDYLAFKLQSVDGLALDEHGKLTGWESTLESLKAQYPTQFSQQEKRQVIPQPLPRADGTVSVTQESFDKMTYKQRLELYKADPDAYNSLTGRKGE